MSRRVNVIGVGMTKFQKPGASDDYNVMAAKAITAAIEDAKVKFEDVEQAFAGYVYGDSTCGQRAVYDVGLTGIPVFNVNNNCSTGSSALMLARQAILAGAECVLAVGFEKMEKGALGSKFTDRANPLEWQANLMNKVQGFNQAPPAAQMFGGAGREYRWKYGTKRETFAKISEKARKHASQQPLRALQPGALPRGDHGVREVFDPLTRYQCCPPTCGAAAAILCSDEFAKKHGISKPVYIAAQAMMTDRTSRSFDEDSMIKMVGYDMTKNAAKQVYERPASAPRTCTSSSSTTASPPTRSSPTRPSASARRARPRSSSGTARTPTAASSSRTPRAACSRRGTRSGRRASRSAPSSSGSSGARPTNARCRARRSRSSTTSASAALAS
jgi:sterol carrier protein 2